GAGAGCGGFPARRGAAGRAASGSAQPPRARHGGRGARGRRSRARAPDRPARRGRRSLPRARAHGVPSALRYAGQRREGRVLTRSKEATVGSMQYEYGSEVFDDLYLGVRAGGALRKRRRGEPLTPEEEEALGRWQRLSAWRKGVAIGGVTLGTFGLGFTPGGPPVGRWRHACAPRRTYV